MKALSSFFATSIAAVLAAAVSGAAQNTIKVGVIAEFSGPFADYGGQIEAGMKAYMKQHGDTVAGKKIELITRDTKGPAPEVAKRFAQELITRDKVQFLAGFGLTPNAMAVAPVVTEAKVPMIISNAATSSITTKSPYVDARVDDDPAGQRADGEWALKNGIKQVYTVVADYGPGIDAETQFTNVQGGRRRGRRHAAHAVAESRFLRGDPAREGCEAAGGVRVPAGGRAGHRVRQELQRARARRGGHQADRHRRHHRRPRACGDGRSDARPHHVVPLFGRARLARERGVPEGLRGGERPEARRAQLHGGRRLRHDGGDLRSGEEARRQHRRRQGDGGDQGHEMDEPARPGDDRSRDAQHHADGVHPQGREEGRQAGQRRVRQDRRTSKDPGK